MERYMTPSRKAFVIFNYIFCVLIALICLMPVINVLSISLSSKAEIMAGNVTFWPRGFTLDNYRYVVKDSQFYTAFGISVLRTVLALFISMPITIMAAYPLSMTTERFPARKVYVWVFVITMLFGGGLIPTYLTVVRTGLLDTIWALLIPGAVSVYNVILLQNFMKSLPDALSEAAFIDGADHITTLVKVTLPLCLPCLATLSLFVVVGNWNAWYDGMLYINSNSKFPLQTYLRTVIVVVNPDQISDVDSLSQMVATVGADSAKIFLALAPVMMVYPLAQKYFIHGLVQGSVKG